MSKKTNYIEINGIHFKEVTKDNANYKAKDLFNAYRNPSYTKRRIWFNWLRWADAAGFDLYIASCNCNFFSIGGLNKRGDRIYITSTRQEIFLAN